jgi:crotonobetainyl-CoA:carnitine CoA-transferase CaiB-like acyl-CoA transferase
VPGTAGAHHPSICPYGLFHAADGMVQIAVGSDRLWSSFATEFGIDRPEWQHNADRVADKDAVVAAVNGAFAGFPRTELMAKLAGLGIPAGQVRSLDEVYAWEQTRSQGLLISVEHATLGSLQLPGPPIRYDDGGRTEHLAPPTLDQHGESIRRWLDEREALDRGEPRGAN